MGDVTLGEGGVCTIKPSWVPHELVHRVSIVTTKLKTTFPKTFLLAIVLALRNPSVGYCQGMGFSCALFLMYMPEEAAFWTMNQVLFPLPVLHLSLISLLLSLLSTIR